MAIVRPTTTDGGTSKYTGVLPVCIWNFEDRSNDFNWCDVFLSVELKIQDSEYSRFLEICGPLEKDASGMVTGGYCLKPLYHLFDILGFKGGLNAKGEWEDEDGVAITNIASHLNDRYDKGNPMTEEKYDHVAYIYKAMPKKQGDKAYTRVYNRIYHNDDTGNTKIKEQVSWMKSKGYLKEWNGLNTSETSAAVTENL